MIEVKDAIEILLNTAKPLQPKQTPILSCLGLISAQQIIAPINVPLFDNAAMDGYAIRYEDYANKITIKVVSEMEAGKIEIPILQSGQAVRIFTGAPIPLGTDTVVQQEICILNQNQLHFTSPITYEANVRKTGTQTLSGQIILKKGQYINAVTIGFLATFGITSIWVHPKPAVGIIVNGKELTAAGRLLLPGHIYESNSVALHASLLEMDIVPAFSIWVNDDQNQLSEIINQRVDEVDVMIITGGISVGDYDFVKPVLTKLNTQEYFYKIKQKPGKPIYYGKLRDTKIFALPGNPSSALMCFHIYVKRFIETIMGQDSFADKKYAILLSAYNKKKDFTYYVKAFVSGQKALIHHNQLPYQMDAYPEANAYVILPSDQETFAMGEKIEIVRF